MRKKLRFLFTLFSLIPFMGFGQVKVVNSLSKALAEAKLSNKKVLVVIYPKALYYFDGKTVLEDEKIAERVNRDFIVYQAKYADLDLKDINKYYSIKDCPNFLFFHPTAELFYRSVEFMASKERFSEILSYALLSAKQSTLANLNQTYLADTTSKIALKNLIDARKNIGIINNAYHIEKYARLLTESEVKNYQTALYILEAGPRINGIAYNKVYNYRSLIDSIYQKESKQKLTELNMNISNNTMETAISLKCLADALNAANYHKSLWGKDTYSGQKIYNEKLLYYYQEIRDTANYFPLAINHYDNFYMSVKTDSIKNMILQEKTKPNLSKPGWRARSYPENLNAVALSFYRANTQNPNYLLKAITWSKNALAMDEKALYYDTLAHLYYKIGNFDQAIHYQEVALNTATAEKISVAPYQIELMRMKSKTL